MIHFCTTYSSNEGDWIRDKIQSEKKSGKKIWLQFGLSANPWHLGHESYVQAIANALLPNLISLVPAKVSPFKGDIPQGAPLIKKEMMWAALAQYVEKCPDSDECQTIVDTQELDAPGPFSFTWETVKNVWERAQEENAVNYFLLTTETVEEFYCWTHSLYIVEHATIVYGDRPGTNFDKIKMVNKLRAIDQIARSQGITETGTSADYATLAKNGHIAGATIEFLIGNGKTERMEIPAFKVRPIHPKVIEALNRGYIPVSGNKDVSSTEIRNKINADLSIDEDVGPLVAEVITRHGLYK